MGQSPCFGKVRAARQPNAAGNQAAGPSNAAGNQAAGPSNLAGNQAAGPSNPAGAVGNMPTAISFSTLEQATHNFSDQIGRGGSARVFKGTLNDGQTVAVKLMKPDYSWDFEKCYDNEVGVLSRSNHPNIIKLIGCCVHNDTERIIVCEYMPNGTLNDRLHARGEPVLTWENRMKIGAGIAEGLRYLHNNVRVLYGDLKPENVLLDAGYNAKLSDFGTSLLLPPGVQTTSDVIRDATPPYVPPEDLGSLSLKYDVYSFGVLLLKIIAGTVKTQKANRYVDDWVLVPENFVYQADPKMKGDFPRGELVKAMTVATKCMNLCRDSRPDIGVVVNAMKNLAGDQDAHWPEIFKTEGIASTSTNPK
ncbi:hypothetical protein CASFOL_012816 [Castilleja foliolosa]|uniref:Protein kinase domain-containing protein n=1 Tax=Castilleja foliolosa TaxID=1961234 RepID=A0ABD3DK10_9LAMI